MPSVPFSSVPEADVTSDQSLSDSGLRSVGSLRGIDWGFERALGVASFGFVDFDTKTEEEEAVIHFGIRFYSFRN